MNLHDITDTLVARLEALEFALPVAHVYNPFVYARSMWDEYVKKFGQGTKEVILLGMNPGPWGMVQTGVPFGEIASVREFLGIAGEVGKPNNEHPKRPVTGLQCPRSEVSGRRVWGWAKEQWLTPERFFERFFVANYCPLAFLEEGGRNRTPDKLPKSEREPLLAVCDEALAATVEVLQPRLVVGIGRFAEQSALRALAGTDVEIGVMPHPSPANPAANRGWSELANRALADLGARAPGLDQDHVHVRSDFNARLPADLLDEFES